MKNLVLVFTIVIMAIANVIAQSPQAINYQAVVRNATGEVLNNTSISLQLSFHEDSETGEIVYQEKHNSTTNEFGLVTLKLGEGTLISGDFSSIAWESKKIFLGIELDPEGGTNYIPMGVSQFLSVPYAMHAETVTNVDDADADPANELNTSIILDGTNLEVTDAGGMITTDLSSLVNDADADSANELNKSIILDGTDLEVTDAGGKITTNLGSLVDDADADPANELNTSIILDGTDLEITDAGGILTTDLVNLVDDADADPANELQTLSLQDKTLTISNGNSAILPFDTAIWSTNGNDIFYTLGNVGIGTDNPTQKFDVNGTIKATLFSGNASSLTNLNASNISTGTLNNSRFNALSDLGGGVGSTFLKKDGTWANPPNTTYSAGNDLDLSGTIFSLKNNIDVESVVATLNDLTVEANDDLYLETNNGDDIYITPGDDVRIDGNTIYVDGVNNRVGIGTSSPGSKFDVNGNVSFEFDFESPWTEITAGQTIVMDHSVGGDPEKYIVFVDGSTNYSGTPIHKANFGSASFKGSVLWYEVGLEWYDLNNATIKLERMDDDNNSAILPEAKQWDYVRVRIIARQ